MVHILQVFVSEYIVIGSDSGQGSLLAALEKGAFMIVLELNRLASFPCPSMFVIFATLYARWMDVRITLVFSLLLCFHYLRKNELFWRSAN